MDKFGSCSGFVFANRSAFSPIFTSGKLKHMKYLMDEIARKLVSRFSEAADSSERFGICL